MKKGLLPSFMDWMADTVRALCRMILLGATVAGAIIFLFDLGRFLINSSDFVVQEITIAGNHRVDQEEIRARSGIAPGTNIWLVNLTELSRRLEKHPMIRRVGVQRFPPHRIHVQIEERAPMALILDPTSTLLYGLDVEGKVLPPILSESFSKESVETREDDVRLALSSPILSGDISLQYEPGAKIMDSPVPEVLQFFKRLEQCAPEVFSQIAEAQWQKEGNWILHPRRRIGALVLRNLLSPELEKKIKALWRVMEEDNLRAVYVDARFPEKGFAVRWEEGDVERWKRRIQPDRLSYSVRMGNSK